MEEKYGGCVRKRKVEGVVDGEVGDGRVGCYETAGLGDDDEEGEYEGIAEESVEEVMRWLEMEISLVSEVVQPGFVTINGNEESCGPSFSTTASTVMASVDTRAGAPPPPPVQWPWPSADEAAREDEQLMAADEAAREDEQLMAGDAAKLIAGEWLVELLAGGPALQEQ